jgi:DNA mismatch repair protein MutS
MTFVSVLFARQEDQVAAQRAIKPLFFKDLNIDQIVNSITVDRSEYALEPFFSYPLSQIDPILYRQEVFKDLERASLLEQVRLFGRAIREVRATLGQSAKLYYRHHKEAWFLDAVSLYCNAVRRFAADLSAAAIESRGLRGFSEYLVNYVSGARFRLLSQEANALGADLAKVDYCVLIGGSGFTVRNYKSEADYSAEILDTFDKFKQGAVNDYLVQYRSESDAMNHIEAKIVEFVAKLHPALFSRLSSFCEMNSGFIDETIGVFDREIQFYVAYLEYVSKFTAHGLQFCFPRLSTASKAVQGCEAFDLALAQKLLSAGASIVCNDFVLSGRERILVVTGPNQGGKTTFARMVGQLHYLASIGCPVPGRTAHLFLFDQLFTHFEREERVETLRGKLEDDLVRVHDILDRATSRSVVIMNEIFTSTTLADQIFLSKQVMRRLLQLDLIGVWVTFVEELTSFSDQTVSMVSLIAPDDPTVRTFKIMRRPADGLAYALAIAKKYRLTYGQIRERMAS